MSITAPDEVRCVPTKRILSASSAWLYAALYLLILQFVLGLVVPTSWTYYYRVPYEAFKEGPHTLDLALDHIEREIRREGLTDYVILLGDSVMYSGPGGPEQSIGYYMEQLAQAEGRPLRVFNLAQPAMQVGDQYIILDKLRRRGIATDRLVINLVYAGFVNRADGTPIVYWLGDDLQQVDPEAWDRYRTSLVESPQATLSRTPVERLNTVLRKNIPLLSYQPILKGRLFQVVRSSAEVYDTRPWTEKPGLPDLMKEYMYQRGFNPEPFDMSAANPQIDFLERILAQTADHPPLIFLSPTNQVLMEANTTHPGYQANLRAVDAWFAEQPAVYRNWESALPDGLFTDQVHLTPEGYKVLAGMILQTLEEVSADAVPQP